MQNRFFYALIPMFFCAILFSACPSSRQANVTVNSTNAESGRSEAPKTNSQTETNQTPAGNLNTKKPDDSKMTAGDASKNDAEEKFENRCGWLENPTPANVWLTDKDGEWLIGTQGGYQAEGDWGDFPDDKWVKTNVNYGYGCACLSVTVDRRAKRILKIKSATIKPLSACRSDAALKEPKE
jgi:hypothetical protein